MKIAKPRLADLKPATVERWKDSQQGVSTAIYHPQQFVQYPV